MSVQEIRPSSLVGIKRLAKSIKVEFNCTHFQALDLAAKRAGFSNLKHAQNVLSSMPSPQSIPLSPVIFISCYWRDKEGNSGLEVLKLPIKTFWHTTYSVKQLYNLKSNREFKQIAIDHIETVNVALSKSDARFIIAKAARTIQFMDATGLKPSSGGSRAYPKSSYSNDVPGHDHSSIWFHPATKAYVIADEPYELAVEKHIAARNIWAEVHDFQIVKPDWKGMYNPEGNTQIYLITNNKKSANLIAMKSALDQLPTIYSDQWTGISEPWNSKFLSDGAKAKMNLDTLPQSKATQKKSVSSGALKLRTNMNPLRKLLVLGLNELLTRNLLSLNWDGPGAEVASGHLKIEIAGYPSVILWQDAGHGEVKISVWWKYDHSKHPQAELAGNARESFSGSEPLAKNSHYKKFVGVVASAWLERQDGKYLQGKEGARIYPKYARAGETALLKLIPNPQPLGYEFEGAWHF